MKNPFRRVSRAPALALLLGAFLGLAGAAQAQWAWRDATGAVTYSDAPPPPDVRPDAILRQPTTINPADLPSNRGDHPSANYDSPGTDTGGNPSVRDEPRRPGAPPARSLAEQDAEFRKRQAAHEKEQQKSADDEAQASERSAACTQAKTYLQMLQDGTRLMRPDAEGNRNFLDDEQRAAETQKAQDAVAKNC